MSGLRDLFQGFAKGRRVKKQEELTIEQAQFDLKKARLAQEERDFKRENAMSFLERFQPTEGSPAVPFETNQEQAFGLPALQGNVEEAAVPAKPGQKLLDILATPEGQADVLAGGLLTVKELEGIRRKKQGFGGGLNLEAILERFRLKGITLDDKGKPKFSFEPLEDDKPLNSIEVQRFIDDRGEHPKVGSTPRDNKKLGFKETTAAEQALALQQRGPLAVLKQLEELGAGLFPEKSETGVAGLVQRGKQGASNLGNIVTQDNPQVSQFQAIAKGATALLIRALGEKGTLNEGDVKRAIMLQPTLFNTFGLPDSSAVFKGKINQIRTILETIKKGGSQAGLDALNAIPVSDADISQEEIDAALKESGITLGGQRGPKLKNGSTVGTNNKVVDFADL